MNCSSQLDFGNAFFGKRVLVTGHTGFKGSWLCHWLNMLGAKVTGLSLPAPSVPSNYELSQVRATLQDEEIGDIRDLDCVRDVLQRTKPDFIFHLAAETVVHVSYRHPYRTFEVNVMGTVALLEGIRELGKPCVVVCVTSDKCYQNTGAGHAFRETDQLGYRDPYGGSKAAAEIAIRSYRESYFSPERLMHHGIQVASARAGNVIGGGDWTPFALIPDLIRSLSVGEPVKIRNPNSIRPWQHALQALDGYLTLASSMATHRAPELCDAWNFGPLPGQSVPVHQIADWVVDSWGSGSWELARKNDLFEEAEQLTLAVDKAVSRLDWCPVWNTYQAVQRTVEWFSEWLSGELPSEICINQIRAYQLDRDDYLTALLAQTSEGNNEETSRL